MNRRRALMTVAKNTPQPIQFLPGCLNWKKNGSNTSLISDDSFLLKPGAANNWSYYVLATNVLTLRYNDLVGKTVVIDFDATNIEQITCGLTLASQNNFSGGISETKGRSSFPNQSSVEGHYHREIAIGTDFTTTNYPTYFLTFYCYGYNATTSGITTTVTNFKCGYLD